MDVAAGLNFSLFGTLGGVVWCTGHNGFGQLGLEGSGMRFYAEEIKTLPNIQHISCGSLHSVFIDENGSAWVCGSNEYGQLGKGDAITKPFLSKVEHLPIIQNVSCGWNHTVFLDFESKVWICGENLQHQLGSEDPSNCLIPERLDCLPPIKQVACGGYFTFFLDFDGVVWCTGINYVTPQKLEIGHKPTSYIACGGHHCLLIDIDGIVWAMGYNSSGQLGIGEYGTSIPIPEQLNIPVRIKLVACGYYHSLFCSDSGTVWSCGANTYGQLGLGYTSPYVLQPVEIPNLQDIRSLAAGESHSLFCDNNGKVWVCGNNIQGQLGLCGMLPFVPKPIPLNATSTIVAGFTKKDGVRTKSARKIDSL